MFRLMKALDFTEVETAEFWVEIETAYAKDSNLRSHPGGTVNHILQFCSNPVPSHHLLTNLSRSHLKRSVVTKWLYPEVAKHYGTNWKAVERNIRSMNQLFPPADNFPFQEFAYVGEFSVDAS